MVKALGIFNVKEISTKLKIALINRNKRIIENNPEWGEDKSQDKNQVDNLLIISYGLQIFKLVTIIANLSFYLGIGWIIFCDLNQKSVEKSEDG